MVLTLPTLNNSTPGYAPGMNTGIDEDTGGWHEVISMGSVVDNWPNTPEDSTSEFMLITPYASKH